MALPEEVRSALDEWRRADNAARTAEDLLGELTWRHLKREGPAVTDEMIDNAKILRAAALGKLRSAMSLMKRGTDHPS